MQGLEGLGNINKVNESCTITSPLMTNSGTTFVEDKRLLVAELEKFGSADEYTNYLYEWLQRSGVVDVSNGITDWYGFKAIQTVVVNDRENQKYMVVGCVTIENVQKIIVTIENSSPKPSIPTVAICFSDSLYAESSRGKAIDVEVMGNEAIREINSAITSTLPYISVGKRFENKIAKALNAKYKSTNGNCTNNITSDLSDAGNSIVSSFKEGINQLAGSIQGAIGFVQTTVKNKSLASIEKEILQLPENGATEGVVTGVPVDNAMTSQEGVVMSEVSIEKQEQAEPENRATPGTMDGPSVILTKQQTGEDIVTPGTMDKVDQTEYEPAEQGFIVETTAEVQDSSSDISSDINSEKNIVVSLEKENNTGE